jgi:hypothetical protein
MQIVWKGRINLNFPCIKRASLYGNSEVCVTSV